MRIQRGNDFIEVRENSRGETTVEIYTPRKRKFNPYALMNDMVEYLIAEGFLEDRPREVAVYSEFGVDVLRNN